MAALERLIGTYTQGNIGPLLVVIGAMHGNEPAGVLALDTIFTLLNEEERLYPDFVFNGSIMGIVGNLAAYEQGTRYVNEDLNRYWTEENFKLAMSLPIEKLTIEMVQMREIIALIKNEIMRFRPQNMVVLDLHSTSSMSGIFSIVSDDELSETIARELHAPVVKGMLQGIEGSSLHFFNGQNMSLTTTAIGFECGMHTDTMSPHRAVAAVINCMRTLGMVDNKHIDNKHDALLKAFSKDLPAVTYIKEKYTICHPGKFEMLPGFKSFDSVRKGQLLAHDGGKQVFANLDAFILMPLYQKEGMDGFFLVT
jgi:succinylglutamate desuccinylase